LNLTRANHVFHFDRWWNPAWKIRPPTEPSASARAGRWNSQVRLPGYREERIDELIERKRSLAEKIVGSGEGWITELSTMN